MTPPLVEDVKACFRNHNRFVEVLRQIAHGPVDIETARKMARDVLIECEVKLELSDKAKKT